MPRAPGLTLIDIYPPRYRSRAAFFMYQVLGRSVPMNNWVEFIFIERCPGRAYLVKSSLEVEKKKRVNVYNLFNI